MKTIIKVHANHVESGPVSLKGLMLFCENGTPFNCVGSWRLFHAKRDADRYYHPAWRKQNGLTLRHVEVEVREVGK